MLIKLFSSKNKHSHKQDVALVATVVLLIYYITYMYMHM